MQTLPAVAGIFLCAAALGCGTGRTSDVSPANAPMLEHREMIDELAALADSQTAGSNVWANEERLAYYSGLTVPSDPSDRLKLQGIVALEFLNSGRSELAAQAFERMLDAVERYPDLAPPGYARTLLHLKAVSQLRLGEQTNCLDDHSGGSCILPVAPDAVHRAREGSENAIVSYSQLLSEDPNDVEAQWLLNIAFATLGKHPGDVPSRFRLSTEQLSGPAGNFPAFRNVAASVGLASLGLSGGGITEDFDGDNNLDLVVSSWGLRDTLRFFQNTGDGHFVERTGPAGFVGITGGLNLVHADYDNDGDFDIFVLRGAWLGQAGAIPNSLLRNDGRGVFTDVTRSAGLYSRHPTQTAAWSDFNNDGWLDLFVGNESSAAAHPSELFRNNGDGTFTDVAVEMGVTVDGFVKGVVWIDFDNDGDSDLYVSRLGEPNRLFENREVGFMDVTRAAGVAYPIHSFPTWSWDFDNDGWEDLLVLPYEAGLSDYVRFQMTGTSTVAVPSLYRNLGNGSFEDVSAAYSLQVPLKAMGSNFGDLDNDGWLDFYVGTGDPDLRTLVPNKMYRNTGELFEDVTRPGRFGHLQKGHAVSFADLDNDGDQDVYTVLGGAFSGDVYRNALFLNPGSANRWLALTLHGHRSNRAGVGARVTARFTASDGGERSVHRTVSSGGSFGASSYRLSLGLGDSDGPVDLFVRWPSGHTQHFEGVQPDTFYLVDEETGLAEQDVQTFGIQ